MGDKDNRMRFEEAILPHLDAAYNLARWLARNDEDARDVVQEACIRAFRFIGSLRGQQAKPWLLAIVRNVYFTTAAHRHAAESYDEDLHGGAGLEQWGGTVPGDPVVAALQRADQALVQHALEALPLEFREALVLRELEGLSYKEIAQVAEIPIGTVMSRLARGRELLKQRLMLTLGKEPWK